ncbi:protein unc-13 homolog D-like [Parasteatoda tepidariorum]|uniref:protein unc-13 homolog D-like n=1 Tax=Parasteatoda tepidariorum TaxID=114398 RepID=UPI0039BD84EF
MSEVSKRNFGRSHTNEMQEAERSDQSEKQKPKFQSKSDSAIETMKFKQSSTFDKWSEWERKQSLIDKKFGKPGRHLPLTKETLKPGDSKCKDLVKVLDGRWHVPETSNAEEKLSDSISLKKETFKPQLRRSTNGVDSTESRPKKTDVDKPHSQHKLSVLVSHQENNLTDKVKNATNGVKEIDTKTKIVDVGEPRYQHTLDAPESQPKISVKPRRSKRQSIAIRKSDSGIKNLVYLESDTDMDTTKKVRKYSRLRSLFSRSKQDLGEKNKLSTLAQDPLTEAFSKRCPKFKESSFNDLLGNEVSEKYLACLYMTCVYTVNNYFGIPSSRNESQKQLYEYVHQLIPLEIKHMNECAERAKRIRAPHFILNLKVIEASQLAATDPDGLADPYCLIWLNDKKQEAKFTSVKEHTINPEWNEAFTFPLKNIANDVIFIQLWDRDPTGIGANLKLLRPVKDIRGCYYFFYDCFDNVCKCRATVDDFLGQTVINVASIYSEGIDEWKPLTTENGHEHQGELRISAKFEVQIPKNIIGALKRHFLLVRLCIEHGLKSYAPSNLDITSWEEILKGPALTLLFQHGVQGNISHSQDLISRFVVLVHSLTKKYSYSYQFLYSILKEADDSMKQSDYYEKIPLEDIFIAAIQSLKTKCFSHLQNFHLFDIVDNELEASRLKFILKSAHLCQEILKVPPQPEIWAILKAEAKLFFTYEMEELKNNLHENRFKIISEFLMNLLEYQTEADKLVKEIFGSDTYTQVIYDVIDDNISETLKSEIQKIASNSRNYSTKRCKEEALNVFISVKEFIDYFQGLSIPLNELHLDNYFEWFELSTIKDWFIWKQEFAADEILKIIGEDDLQNQIIECGGRIEKQSSSPKDCSKIIEREICQLWNITKHSNYPQCDEYFLRSLHYCGLKYAGGIIELIQKRELIENGEIVRRTICVIANSLWSFSTYISKTISETVSLKVGQPHTTLCLRALCKVLCRDLTKEHVKRLENFILNVAEAGSKKKQHKSLSEYSNFLNHTFRLTYSRHMAFEIYLLFQNEMWDQVVNLVFSYKDVQIKRSYCVYNIQKFFGTSAEPSEGLFKILQETEKVLYLDKEGKLRKIFFDNFYISLKRYLIEKTRDD